MSSLFIQILKKIILASFRLLMTQFETTRIFQSSLNFLALIPNQSYAKDKKNAKDFEASLEPTVRLTEGQSQFHKIVRFVLFPYFFLKLQMYIHSLFNLLSCRESQSLASYSLCEKCPNTEFYSGPYLDTFHAVIVKLRICSRVYSLKQFHIFF